MMMCVVLNPEEVCNTQDYEERKMIWEMNGQKRATNSVSRVNSSAKTPTEIENA